MTIRKRHIYINIRWPWVWNQYFYLGIWNDDRTKKIVLYSLKLATLLNSQNRNETEFLNEFCHINLYMNIGISNWHNWFSDPRKWSFFTLFHFITRWLPSKYLKLFSTCLLGEIERCWKRAFQLLKMRKKKISLNIKTKCITDFLSTISSSRMKDYTCHYEVRN